MTREDVRTEVEALGAEVASLREQLAGCVTKIDLAAALQGFEPYYQDRVGRWIADPYKGSVALLHKALADVFALLGGRGPTVTK